MALLKARESVMARFRPSLRQHDITEQQWRVLRAMASVGEIEVTHLAEMVFLLPPSLSRILEDLTARRLLARRLSQADMRRSLVTLTDEGRALIAKVTPYSEKVYADIEQMFGSQELHDLCARLAALEKTLTEGRAPPSSQGRRLGSRAAPPASVTLGLVPRVRSAGSRLESLRRFRRLSPRGPLLLISGHKAWNDGIGKATGGRTSPPLPSISLRLEAQHEDVGHVVQGEHPARCEDRPTGPSALLSASSLKPAASISDLTTAGSIRCRVPVTLVLASGSEAWSLIRKTPPFFNEASTALSNTAVSTPIWGFLKSDSSRW